MSPRNNNYFPVYLSLKGRKCLVVGGGSVAERKIRAMLPGSPRVSVIAPEVTPGIGKLAAAGRVEWQRRKFRTADLTGSFLVFAATSDEALNVKIAGVCEKKGIAVNVAKPGGSGSFIVPAVIEEGDISVAVSTGGGAPGIAGLVRDEFRDKLKKYDKLLKILKPYRQRLLTETTDSAYNKQLMREFFRHPLMTWLEEGETSRIQELAAEIFRRSPGKKKP